MKLERSLTGPDLAAERIRRGIFARDVAARMGLSAPSLSTLEHRFRVSDDSAERYLAALQELVDAGRGMVVEP